jgi:hypothetical protein
MIITSSMNKLGQGKKTENIDSDQIPDDFIKSELLDNLFRPNVQFIRRAKQLNPRAKELLEIFKKFRDILKIKGIQSISTRTGSGYFINTANFDLGELNRDNIIEVIDYDPVRNNMMVIGNDPPASDAVLHWFIYRGFPNINGVINIDNSDIFEEFLNNKQLNFPNIDLITHHLDLASTMNILKSLKESSILLLKNSGVLATGRTIGSAFEAFENGYNSTSKKKG